MTTKYTPKDVYNFARDGDVEELIIALNQGDNSTNWYKNKNGHTALHFAAYRGFTNIVEILLNRGIDIISKDNDGDTALHLAAQEGHINIVEMLLNRGIDINSKDNHGYTALHWAAQEGHINICLLYTSDAADE